VSRRALVGLAIAIAAGTPVEAQRVQPRAIPPLAQRAAQQTRVDTGTAGNVPWYAPLASLAVPGLGQALLGDDRAVAYVAVEVYAVLEYRAQRAEALRGQSRYREIARDVARAIFPGPRATAPFEYYEAMRKYTESGAFDRVQGGDVDPEIDETTYNGSIWRLARDTYWSDPSIPPPQDSEAYRAAVSLYLQRAVLPEYQWSWRNAALEHDLYRTTIDRSNRAFRRARTQFGILLANHLLSMADALATVRVRYPASASRNAWEIEIGIPWPAR
jgi:hypothetical protein